MWHKKVFTKQLGKNGEIRLQLVVAFRNFMRDKLHVDNQVLHTGHVINPVSRSPQEHDEATINMVLSCYLEREGEALFFTCESSVGTHSIENIIHRVIQESTNSEDIFHGPSSFCMWFDDENICSQPSPSECPVPQYEEGARIVDTGSYKHGHGKNPPSCTDWAPSQVDWGSCCAQSAQMHNQHCKQARCQGHKLSEWQGFSAGRNLLPLHLLLKALILGWGYGFSGGKRTGFCDMEEEEENIIMAHAILIPPVITSVKVYYRMHRLRPKKDERDPSHGCGVIVGLLKMRGMRRTYLLHMIKPFNCLFPW